VIPYNDSSDADGSNPSASATTPLLAPDNVAAVALSSTNVEIVWDDQSAAETGFEVQRSTDGTNFTNLGSTAAGATDYTDTTAAASTEYWYRVESTNSAAGSSAPSASADATTPATPVSDGGPATPTLTANPVSTSEIDLTAAAPTDSSHLELEEQGPSDDNFAVADVIPTSSDGTLTYAVTGLTNGAEYTFRLRADLNGLESYSAVVSATPEDPDVPAPYNLTATPSDGLLDLTFQWDGSLSDDEHELNNFETETRLLSPADPYGPITGQSVNYFYQTGGCSPVSGDTYDIYTSIPYPGFELEQRVRYGDSAWSNWGTATESGTVLPTPQNLTVVDAGDGQVTASWDAVDISNVSPYPGQLSYELIGVNAAHSPFFEDNPSDTTDTFPAPANVVSYYVFAIAGSDMSGYSNAADAPDQSAPVPAAPQNLSATPYSDGTSAGIRLLWDNDSDNETGYTIQRSTSAGKH